jgi:uncharacterized protein
VRFVVIALLACGACQTEVKREDPPMPPKPSEQPSGPRPTVYVESPAGDVAVTVEVVATEAKIERGLMYREHLGVDAGMLFIMGAEKDWSFWMRNTLIPLDMLFISRDKHVVGIVERAEPKTETLRKVGALSFYVLEVNGGWARTHQVAPGAKIRFENIPE